MPPIHRRVHRNVGPVLTPNSVTAAPVETYVRPQYVAANRALPRDAQLVTAVKNLDAYSDPRAASELAQWLSDTYAAKGCGFVVGMFSHCYLGAPFVDHQLDIGSSILRHFTESDPVPAMFEPCRPLARSTAYAFIEVYADGTIIAVRDDGTPVVASPES